MISLLVLSRVRVAQSLVFCVVICRSLFVLFCPFSFGHCVVCPSVFWPLCCLSFCLLAIVLSFLLSFGHCVVFPSVFWPLCCLSFCLLAIVLSFLLSFGHCVVFPSSIYGEYLELSKAIIFIYSLLSYSHVR